MFFFEALEYCRDLIYNGFNDFRLPTIQEYILMRQTLATPDDMTLLPTGEDSDYVWTASLDWSTDSNAIYVVKESMVHPIPRFATSTISKCRCIR